MTQDESKAAQQAIQKLLETLGEEVLHEKEGPGVYYLTVKGYGEFYIVEQASPIISDAAKSYGKRCPDYADLLFYSLAEECGGSKIIDYGRSDFCIFNSSVLPQSERIQQYLCQKNQTVFLDTDMPDAVRETL